MDDLAQSILLGVCHPDCINRGACTWPHNAFRLASAHSSIFWSNASPSAVLLCKLLASGSSKAKGWHHGLEKHTKLKNAVLINNRPLLISSGCPPCFRNHYLHWSLTEERFPLCNEICTAKTLQPSLRAASCSIQSICTCLCAGSKEGRYKCKWGYLLWQRRLTAPNVWFLQVVISIFCALPNAE